MARRTIQVLGEGRNEQQDRANQFTPVAGPGSVPAGYAGDGGGRPQALPQTPMISVGERRAHYRQDLRERRTQSSQNFLQSVQRNNLAREAAAAANQARYGSNAGDAAAAEARLSMREQNLGVDTRQNQYRQSADTRANMTNAAENNRTMGQGEMFRGQGDMYRGQGDMYRGQGDMYRGQGQEALSRGRYNDALTQYQVPAQANETNARAGLYGAQARDIPEAAVDRRTLAQGNVSVNQQDAATRARLGGAQAGHIDAEAQQVGPNSAAQRGRYEAETKSMGAPSITDVVEAEERMAGLREKYPDQYPMPQTPVPMGGGVGPARRQGPDLNAITPEQWQAEAARRNITVDELRRQMEKATAGG